MRQVEQLVRAYSVTHGTGAVRFPQHPEWHELIHARSGVVRIETQAGRWSLPPARALWLAAGTPAKATVVHRASMRILYLPRSSPVLEEAVATVEMSVLAAALVQRIAERAPLHLNGDGAHWLHVLATEIEPSPAAPLSLPNPPAGPAGDVAALLEADPGRPESLDALAAAVGASRRTIERSFRSGTGMSAGAWRRRLRLAAALEDLGAGMAVGAVATRAGYASQSAFGAAFRKQFGVSPLSYVRG